MVDFFIGILDLDPSYVMIWVHAIHVVMINLYTEGVAEELSLLFAFIGLDLFLFIRF